MPRFAIIALSLCIVVIAPLAAETVAPRPRIAVLAFLNETGKPSYDAACEAATETLTLCLTSMNSYEFLPAPKGLARQGASLDAWAERNNVDTILYGSISLETSDEVKATLRVFDRQKNATLVVKESPRVKPLDIFQASDDLAASVIDAISGVHIGFGSIEFVNTGGPGSYWVEIDGREIGENLASVPKWITGKHVIVIKQKSASNETTISRIDAAIIEGTTFEAEFKLPAIATKQQTIKISDLAASADSAIELRPSLFALEKTSERQATQIAALQKALTQTIINEKEQNQKILTIKRLSVIGGFLFLAEATVAGGIYFQNSDRPDAVITEVSQASMLGGILYSALFFVCGMDQAKYKAAINIEDKELKSLSDDPAASDE